MSKQWQKQSVELENQREVKKGLEERHREEEETERGGREPNESQS